MVFSQQPERLSSTDLVEILGCRPHLFPGLVQQLDTDPKELLKGPVMSEEHRVVVIAPFVWELPDLQDLAEHLGELNGTSAEWTLVLVLPATVLQHDLQAERKWGLRGGRQGWTSGMRGCPGLYPDVGVLVDFGQVQHVVQGQHSRRSLGEVQGWVDMVLEKPGEQV